MDLPKFINPNLLKQSLSHRSAVNEGKGESHNERLEFLGDAVLELVISEFVYLKFPDYQEGKLTQFRTALVRTETLAKLANELNIPKSIFISKGEKKEGGEYNASLLADTIEAVIGSIFLDKGLDAAKKFIYSTLLVDADKKIKIAIMLDSKSELQEIVQEKLRVTPTYRILEETGPDHEKKFMAGVFFGEEKAAQGKGFSKQDAERAAAVNALKTWKKENSK